MHEEILHYQLPIERYVEHGAEPLREQHTVDEAIIEIRKRPPNGEADYLYVVDELLKLKGTVSTRALLRAQGHQLISEIMLPCISIPSSANLELACELFIMHKYRAMPVVDAAGVYIGILPVDVYLLDQTQRAEMAERESFEELFQVIGIHLDRFRGRSWKEDLNQRRPWLFCTLVGGLVAALISAQFEGLVTRLAFLVSFIPVMLQVSDSISMQSVSLSITTFNHGYDRKRLWLAFKNELRTGLRLGFEAGLIVGTIAGVYQHSFAVAICLGIAMNCAMVCSSVFGLLFPVFLKRWFDDPHVAAGPLVLATSETITLPLYFGLASVLL